MTSFIRWLGGDTDGHRCGYCKNSHGMVTQGGLWAFILTPMHYQKMIDRGWRRSGLYCYRPWYEKTCCQLYTIRCATKEFKMSKSMRHCVKRFNDYLIYNKMPKNAKSVKFKSVSYKVAPNISNGVYDVMSWLNRSSEELERTLTSWYSEWVNTSHDLSVLLVKSSPKSEFFKATVAEEHLIYTAYQCNIHGDKPNDCTMKQFSRFLVETPFDEVSECAEINDYPSFGAYHMQFRINKRLIAVSVIDVLPYCVSSVYCFYDPAFSFLNLGTFTALFEIALSRALNSFIPSLDYYYMGYFVNTCQKMKYKGNFGPAFLLCPESMRWQSLNNSLQQIEKAENKYTRLDADHSAVDEDGELAKQLVQHSQNFPSVAAKLLGLLITELEFV